MVRNYCKIALRNMVRHKGHAFINIAGLAVGLAVVMLIGLWIYDELSFDRQQPNYDRVAQVWQTRNFSGQYRTDNAVPRPLEEELRTNYGRDFKHIVLSSWTWQHILSAGDKRILQPGNYMQPDAPELLSLNMLEGTRASLQDPAGILLSVSTAKALFGNSSAVNQTIRLDNAIDAKVTGVYKDLPANSTFNNLQFIAAWPLYEVQEDWVKRAATQWENNSFQLYVELAGQADMTAASARIKDSKLKHLDDTRNTQAAMFLHPMSRWHLYEEFRNGVNTGGRIEYVWLFGIIGIFVLMLACINFMNLSTARSEKRAREVGIRKAIGSRKWQLVLQFFFESLCMVALAFAVALLLVSIALPFFNEVAAKKMELPYHIPAFWLVALAVGLITCIVAGSYPALFLSSFQPVKVLKGTFKVGQWSALPRKVLVVLQFTVSVVLIVGTIVVFRQVQFARNRPAGYDRERLISTFVSTDVIHKNFPAMRQALLQRGIVDEMSEASSPLTRINSNTSGLEWKGKGADVLDDFGTVAVDAAFAKTVNWQFIQGRNFIPGHVADSSAMILNEAAVKYMGLKDPVGQVITWDRDYHVIGVVKDMVMQSPYEPSKQTIFTLLGGRSEVVNIKIAAGKSNHDALAAIEEVFRKYAPAAPFDYKFIDEEYARKFADEERVGKLAGFFSLLAIFISCLGLFGMASFMAEQRVREIGVRKVLGASVFNLWGLLSKEFVMLVLVSLAIALPLSYWCMHQWLQQYTYRTAVSWWILMSAGIGALTITLLTVSYQAIRAALANPVKSLRAE